METWFLLFDGSSPDGRGQPDFAGRTTDKAKAKKHYEACRKNPYSVGQVIIVTDHSHKMADAWTNWDVL